MKKTLYSLMLSDDVIREIDILAHRMGTNRSSLVNRILAEHVSVMTPEQQINDIFSALQEMLSPSRELVPFFEPNMPTMSLKSCLEYKYRPTVRYEVALSGMAEGSELGTLSVIFRTQSAALISVMDRFFRLIKQIEDSYLPEYPGAHEYALYEGKFTRSIVCTRDMTSRELAAAINNYITLFDMLMKGYVSGQYSADDVASLYIKKLADGKILI